MIFDPCPKNVLDFLIRKKYNQWRNMEHFVGIFVVVFVVVVVVVVVSGSIDIEVVQKLPLTRK